jgi:hypothetical protein
MEFKLSTTTIPLYLVKNPEKKNLSYPSNKSWKQNKPKLEQDLRNLKLALLHVAT